MERCSFVIPLCITTVFLTRTSRRCKFIFREHVKRHAGWRFKRTSDSLWTDRKNLIYLIELSPAPVSRVVRRI